MMSSLFGVLAFFGFPAGGSNALFPVLLGVHRIVVQEMQLNGNSVQLFHNRIKDFELFALAEVVLLPLLCSLLLFQACHVLGARMCVLLYTS